MVRVKEDYFKGGDSFFQSPELSELLDDMDANGVERAILMTKIASREDRALQFVEERPDRFALGVGGFNLLRPMPTLRDARVVRARQPGRLRDGRPELLGRRHVPAERRRLLPALHEVLRARPAALHEHRHPRAAAAGRGAEPDPPRPGLHPLPRAEAVHDPRRRPVVGHRDPPDAEVPEPAADDLGVVAQAPARVAARTTCARGARTGSSSPPTTPVLSMERCLGEVAALDLPDEVRRRGSTTTPSRSSSAAAGGVLGSNGG